MSVPRLIANDNVTLRAAALAGNGIAMLPRYVSGEALRTGQLVELLRGFSTAQILVPRPRHPASRQARADRDTAGVVEERLAGSVAMKRRAKAPADP